MDDHSGQFCESLAAVLNVVLEGKVPADIRPAFFGGKLLASRKKDGGLRPIAFGMTLRRVIAKIVCSKVAERAVAVLSPGQVGFNVRGGAEAIVHGTRQFINENPEITKAIVKVDFRNAFNTVSREVVLDAVKSHFPEYFAFFQSAYGHHSSLFIGEHVMSSESGLQQGDPLGPLLFCLALQAVILTLNTELNAWYLDDGTLGGLPESVQENFARVIEGARRIGLEINVTKWERYVSGGSETAQQKAVDDFLAQHPGVRVMSSSSLTLLGAPILDAAIAPLFAEKAQSLATVCERMQLLPRHHALFFLRHCLGAPKIVYMLRCSNAWKYSEQLYKIDEVLRSCFQQLCNVRTNHDDYPSWRQASLPVSRGGISLRRSEELALPAFLASIHSVADLVSLLLPNRPAVDVSTALKIWKAERCTTDDRLLGYAAAGQTGIYGKRLETLAPLSERIA
ncbi:uncharacterized protein LOC129588896 [Paramacrobiotus metropolitanus]|uniref:uncharacterized protein LOC129588896 n=1 Tax=Paramacrobiotus metropolitanus TaxID=2943436 RepID=UPI002445799C|nr:uncharacterized protein LOC129588896 [Paramacrobiotus metropolitanus]